MLTPTTQAAFGLVRSPLATTFMQVTSRLWVVLIPVGGAPCAVGGGPFTGLMVLSRAAAPSRGRRGARGPRRASRTQPRNHAV